MKISATHPIHARRRGIAIVVVVSLVALLTLLILAFLLTSSTNRNSANSDVTIRQADSLAGVAKETVIADLIAEMKAGSLATAPTSDGKLSFTVEIPKSMVPFRALKSGVSTDPKFALLVKQSANATKFHDIAGASPAGSNRASSVSTTTPAIDGRKIAEIRWNAPKFFEPGATLTNTQVPDWIYTTRKGTNPTTGVLANSTSLTGTGTPNPEYVVGRYAYQIYDVSGLLDVNVAGNVSAAAPVGVLARKGSLVWADLATLPGASGISAIADWRRSSSKSQPVEEFIKEWGGLHGWTQSPLVSGQSDNTFLSRKDLLAYQKTNPSVIPDSLLPYFTTASRELNQPSWSPTVDAGVGFQYKTNKDSPTASNRRLLGVRVSAEFTRRDGTKAKVGEPLLRRRFPLSRMKAFADNNMADIQNYFGLVPAAKSGTTTLTWTPKNLASGKIKRLDQVAAENREPDFFETLKAGLLEGSLGNSMTKDSFFTDLGRDGPTDYQILRTGASIIDQWDADDDPTIIEFGLTNPLTGVRSDDVAGVENLPYFHFIGESRFRRRDTAAPPNDSVASTFLTFQLWNPHKNVVDGKVAAGTYRLAFAGTSRMEWRTNPQAGYPDPGYAPYNRDSPTRTAAFATDYLQFTVGASSTFSQPIYLKPGIAAGVTSSNPIDSILAGGAPVIGYKVGEITAPYTSLATHPLRYSSNGMFSRFDSPMAFALQKKIAGTWVSYQIIPNWSRTHGFLIGSLVDNTDRLYTAAGKYVNLHGMLIDPRTTRYGISTTTQGVEAMNQPTGYRGYDNLFWPPASWTTPTGPARRPEQYQGNEKFAKSRVVHRDGVRRPADAGAPFTDPAQRPEILNRPFQSVADMGLAFRDDPWTSINFFGDPEDSTNPGDGALLDLFSLTETPLRAGVVNPNTAPVAVLKTLLSQASIREGSSLTASQAGDYAKSIRAALDLNPMLNPADIAALAGKVATSASIPGFRNNKDIQVIARALADVANVRTWNLLVDVIAQSGKLSPGTTKLDQFIAQAERRYWYHIAIDRFTGEIVHFQKENIAE